jgi:hypothetical protein
MDYEGPNQPDALLKGSSIRLVRVQYFVRTGYIRLLR